MLAFGQQGIIQYLLPITSSAAVRSFGGRKGVRPMSRDMSRDISRDIERHMARLGEKKLAVARWKDPRNCGHACCCLPRPSLACRLAGVGHRASPAIP